MLRCYRVRRPNNVNLYKSKIPKWIQSLRGRQTHEITESVEAIYASLKLLKFPYLAFIDKNFVNIEDSKKILKQMLRTIWKTIFFVLIIFFPTF